LSPLTTYYYCAVATNGSGTTYGNVVSFKTAGAPTVTTAAATGLGSTGATLNGSVNPNGLSTNAWFRYFTSNPGTCVDSGGTQTTVTGIGAGTSAQPLTFDASGLSPSTQYWYCAIATNSGGTSLGNVVTFTTTAAGGAPTSVTTNAATAIGTTGATLNGSANPNGLSTTGWFRYSSSNPGTCTNSFGTATAPTSSLGSGTGSQAYTFNLTGVAASTTYWYCAIASNSGGTTTAGNVVSFTTSAPVTPTLTATPSSVAAGGNVTVSWSNVTGPTTRDWIGLYHPADANAAFTDWIYDNSCTKTAGSTSLSSGSCSFHMPTTPGTYQFRLLANDGFTVIATSASVTVGPTLTATPSSVAAGGNVTVNWSNVTGPTTKDWIGLYHPADANTAFTDWIYDNSCTKTAGGTSLSSGSCSFPMPTTPGTYQFRLLANDGFTVIATSGSVTVS
jgi:hypothetical protein